MTGTSANIKSDSFSGFLKFISTRYLHHNKTSGLFQSIVLQPHFAGWCLSLEADPQKGTYNNSRRTKFSTLTLKICHKPRKACIFPPAPIRHIGSVPALDSPLQAIRSPLPVLQKNLGPRIHESDSETKWTLYQPWVSSTIFYRLSLKTVCWNPGNIIASTMVLYEAQTLTVQGQEESSVRERPTDHKPGDRTGPSPGRPGNAETTQKMTGKHWVC